MIKRLASPWRFGTRRGKSVGKIEFDPAELAPRINKQLLHDVVVMYETNRRVGTVMTRNRAQTEGSTKKLFRQKGTGRARWVRSARMFAAAAAGLTQIPDRLRIPACPKRRFAWRRAWPC